MKLVLPFLAALFLGSLTIARADEKKDASKGAATPADASTTEDWIQLFDGKTLAGWKASENPEHWKVADGTIVASGSRSHLFYIGGDESHPAEFVNFHFKAEVMTRPGSNSGIFIHTRYQPEGWPTLGYEVQVNNSHTDPVRTGSLYYVVKIFEAPAKDDTWFTQEVIVNGKAIRVKIDGRTLYEYDEPDGVVGTHKLSHGTFALQAHDPKSTTFYKNIMVARLPDSAPAAKGK